MKTSVITEPLLITVPVTNSLNRVDKDDYSYIEYEYAPSLFSLDYRKLDEIIKELKELKKRHGKGYKNLEFRNQRNCGCWGCCDCSDSLVLYGTRLETELEVSVRVDNEKRSTQRQEEKEREELKRLQEKYKNG